MKKLIAKFGIRDFLSFNAMGVVELDVDGKKKTIEWERVIKVVFVGYFEEYSGYFLTEEYKAKDLYDTIVVNCKKNTVKVRTEGKQSIKKNVLEPFKTKFGTTSFFNAVFVEYKTIEGNRNMYVTHFEKSKKKNQIESLKKHLSEGVISEEERADGFVHLASQ